MRRVSLLCTLMLLTALGATGCASRGETKQVQPLTVYSAMDGMALVYGDPAATAPMNDHPLRWIGYATYPVGVAMDYLLNRPLYTLASWAPWLSGYNAEDAMLDQQRPGRTAR